MVSSLKLEIKDCIRTISNPGLVFPIQEFGIDWGFCNTGIFRNSLNALHVVYRYLPWVLLSLLLIILYKRTIIIVNYDFYDDLLKPMRNSRNVLNSEMPGFSSRNPGIKNATAIPGFGISGLQSRLNIFHSIYFARRSVTPRRYGLSLPTQLNSTQQRTTDAGVWHL